MARPTASAPAAPARHSPAAPARHSLQPAHRGRDSDVALPPRSELRLRFFAEKPITGPAPKVREICCPRSITPGVFFPSPGQRRRSVSEAVLAASLTECFFTTHTLPSILAWQQDCPFNPAVATGLLHPILPWQQDCPFNPAVATGLLHPILLWQQDCPFNPAVATGLLHPILLWQQDCPFNPAVATGLLHPFLCWQQECPGASRAARAWNCSSPSAGL